MFVLCGYAAAQTPNFACAPSSPVATPGETVRLYTWDDSPAGAKPVYRWTVSAGEVQSAAKIFSWKIASDSNGPQTADGELRSGSIVEARCTVEVQVIPKRRPSIATGFLTPGHNEEAGAGLYSYLLIADSSNKPLLQSVVKAWLGQNPNIAELQRLLKPGESISLNIPVSEPPTSAPDTEWLLQHYDFARAGTLLEKVSLTGKPGVYLVSSLKPLAASSPPYLIQNLSKASPARAAAWVEAFINQAAQERSWNPVSQSDLASSMKWIAPL